MTYQSEHSCIQNALTIAGSDSGGGAGIQADLKTFSACGVFGTSVITAITAQNTHSVTAIHPVPSDVITAQIEAVLSDIRISAIKVGMLGDASTIETVASALKANVYDGPLVVDPVMVSKSGDRLLKAEAIHALQSVLIPQATLITPNLPEAAELLGVPEPNSEQAMQAMLPMLLELGSQWVLLKGGHLSGDSSVDLLSDGRTTLRFPTQRIPTKNTHGTGCTLSSAIASGLAKGLDMPDAVSQAKAFVTEAIKAADQLQVGQGHGPLHHFHAFWNAQNKQ
jgi:hydroxymethylpyrimidine/phosphomethylpyrimidine kinase